MSSVHRLICSCFGIGYVPKASGTVAAFVCCCVWYLLIRFHNNLAIIIGTLAIVAVGIWSAGKVESAWGKDNRRVVIDEWAGMCVSLWFVPLRWQYLVIGFILFRFFDIAKPFYIRKLESLPGGWGVMADDLLAALYTNLVLQLIILFNLF